MRYLFLFLLFPILCFGAVNEKYSYKDFTHQSFKHLNEDEFNGKGDIIGSCFYHEARLSDDEPMIEIFPDDMRGVTFIRCNLDNIMLPPGNFLGERNSHKRIKIQSDGFDWVLDENNNPIKKIEGASDEE